MLRFLKLFVHVVIFKAIRTPAIFKTLGNLSPFHFGGANGLFELWTYDSLY